MVIYLLLTDSQLLAVDLSAIGQHDHVETPRLFRAQRRQGHHQVERYQPFPVQMTAERQHITFCHCTPISVIGKDDCSPIGMMPKAAFLFGQFTAFKSLARQVEAIGEPVDTGSQPVEIPAASGGSLARDYLAQIFEQQHQVEFICRGGLESEFAVELLRILVLRVNQHRTQAGDTRGLERAQQGIFQ